MKLVNKSPWPTPALNVLCRWVAKRENLPQRYVFTIRSCERGRRDWGGRGGRMSQRSWLKRRFAPEQGWPYTVKDHRFSWSEPHTLRSRVELLVYLLAHEAHHATDYLRPYRKSSAKELRCNDAGMKAVEALRIEWPMLRAKIKTALRLARKREDARKMKAEVARQDQTPKLLAARKAFAVWQRKARLAATKIRKYRRRVAYYEGKRAALEAGSMASIGEIP